MINQRTIYADLSAKNDDISWEVIIAPISRLEVADYDTAPRIQDALALGRESDMNEFMNSGRWVG
jgi:hypothetical protein